MPAPLARNRWGQAAIPPPLTVELRPAAAQTPEKLQKVRNYI